MDDYDPMNDGELPSADVSVGLRGVSAPHGLHPTHPMDAAAIDKNLAFNALENEFRQDRDVRGQVVKGIDEADQPSLGAESPGRAAAEPGPEEPRNAPPAAPAGFSPAALQSRVELMLVSGGEGPVRSGWPPCCTKVTNESLRAGTKKLTPVLSRVPWQSLGPEG